MAITLHGLQGELDALRLLCPVLLPSVVPQGYDDEDLWGLVHTEGKDQQEEFKAFLKASVKQRKQEHTEASRGCSVCGTAGTPTCHSDAREDEGQALRFTTLPTVSFVERTIRLNRAGFVCGTCRALQDPGRFLVFAAGCASSSAPPQLQQERHAVASELCLHLASVNHAPEEVQANSQALMVWAHEVIARAYALQVLASNLDGWKVLSPDEQPVTQATPGVAVHLLRTLLAGTGKKPRRKSAAAGTPAPAPAAQQPANQPSKAAAAAMPQPASQPSRPKGSKLSEQQQQQLAQGATQKPDQKSKKHPAASSKHKQQPAEEEEEQGAKRARGAAKAQEVPDDVRAVKRPKQQQQQQQAEGALRGAGKEARHVAGAQQKKQQQAGQAARAPLQSRSRS